MYRLLISVWLWHLFGVTAVAAQTDVARIEQLYADYRSAVETSSIPGYLSALHPDVRLLPPGATPIVGAERYAGFLEPVFEKATYRIEVISGPEVEVVGDLAIAEYVYRVYLTLIDPGVDITQEGALSAQQTTSRYLDVLRKKENGDWAIWRHTWTVLEEQSD